jgi:hypothetical protein
MHQLPAVDIQLTLAEPHAHGHMVARTLPRSIR